MRMKVLAGCAFLLNTIFFATYYAVTKEALNRIDPIVFTFFEMVSLAPAGLLIILFSWKDMNRAVVKRGVLLGSTLCLALFTIAIALKYTTATSTGFFPALNGVVAALIAWVFFREPLTRRTWLAGGLSLGGAALLIFSSSIGNLRGTLIAFLGGLFYTGYIFLSDHEQKNEKAHWPLFGIEVLTTAAWANLVALLFGDWQAVQPALPKDIWVILYVSIACTFIPTLITVLFQKYISPVTVSFIYILEPVLGAVIASLYLGEMLPLQGYVGGGLVVLGALINTWNSIGQHSRKHTSGAVVRPTTPGGTRGQWVSTLLYPGLGCVLGTLLLVHLGGVPPAAWDEVSRVWPQFPQDVQQGQGAYVTLLLVQAGGWLIAWLSVALMGGLALSHLPHLSRQLLHSILPAQRKETALALVEQPDQPRTIVLPPEISLPRTVAQSPVQVRARARITTRLPEHAQLPVPMPTVPSARSLPAHPSWYGNVTWNRVAVVGLGPETPPPTTGPLPQSLQLRQALLDQVPFPQNLSLETLDT